MWARRQGAPWPEELLQPSRAAISDIRDIDVTDLLGRHVIDTDLRSIATYLTGKRVLVTGAGGSIGSELCRQISRFEPAELIMLDRDESALHAVQLSLTGRALLDTDDTVLGDIRDAQFVTELFETRRPQVVFHAAALKHLPLAGEGARRGDQDQRLGHPDRARGGRGLRRRAVRQHLDRQGRQPVQRARLLQAARRGPDRRDRQRCRRHLPERALRQRARQSRLGAHRLRDADRHGWSRHRHRPARDPLLHDHRRGRAAGDPGRCRRAATARRWCSTWASRSASTRSPTS